MKRLATSALLSLMAVFAIAQSADAGLGWCRRDPIVVLGGVRVQILVSIEQEYEQNVTGPIEVVVMTPAGVPRETVFTDLGFNGHGEVVYWGDLAGGLAANGFAVAIAISVPTDLSFNIPMQVDVIPDIGSPATVWGENAGLTVGAWVSDETIRTGSVQGADAIASTPGEAAIGASATGSDATTPIADPTPLDAVAADPAQASSAPIESVLAEVEVAGAKTPVDAPLESVAAESEPVLDTQAQVEAARDQKRSDRSRGRD